jgi:hypothetical protein
MQILIEPVQHYVIKAEGRALNNWTMVSVVSLCRAGAKSTAIPEPVQGDLSILADLDEVATGITRMSSATPSRDCLTDW